MSKTQRLPVRQRGIFGGGVRNWALAITLLLAICYTLSGEALEGRSSGRLPAHSHSALLFPWLINERRLWFSFLRDAWTDRGNRSILSRWSSTTAGLPLAASPQWGQPCVARVAWHWDRARWFSPGRSLSWAQLHSNLERRSDRTAFLSDSFSWVCLVIDCSGGWSHPNGERLVRETGGWNRGECHERLLHGRRRRQ